MYLSVCGASLEHVSGIIRSKFSLNYKIVFAFEVKKLLYSSSSISCINWNGCTSQNVISNINSVLSISLSSYTDLIPTLKLSNSGMAILMSKGFIV